MKSLTLIIALAAAPAYALETDKAAHLGVSYLLQTTMYGTFKATGMPKVEALLFSGILVFMGTAAKEYICDKQPDGRDILYNGLGQALSIGTVLLFRF